MEILFYEDDAQLEKILTHRFITIGYAVLYKGRTIFSIKSIRNSHVLELESFISFVKDLFSIKLIICEYANLIPRLFALILNIKIESHIFGNIEKKDVLRFYSLTKECGRFKRFLVPAYADFFYIYGEKNPTRDIGDILLSKGLEVNFLPRLDLDKLKKINTGDVQWVLFIGQPWRELGFQEMAELQEALIDALSVTAYKYFFCKHPRQNLIPVTPKFVINGWKGLIAEIKEHGSPICAISINSSLLFELEEAGVATICIGSRVDGDYVYPSKSEAVSKMISEAAAIININ